ncbi:hypothetical protein SNE40_018754 [Patella caerulea]|uniref:Kinesin motor domain-containing protein n=1 Tax=Patella caerulea TaxID=87958 RepID=A0AAN8J5G7_PATCE
MPLGIDRSHFLSDKVRECERQLRNKDERIAGLETENGMLYLKLAQLRSELQSSREELSTVKHKYSEEKQFRSQVSSKAQKFKHEIDHLRKDLSTVQSVAAELPQQFEHHLLQASSIVQHHKTLHQSQSSSLTVLQNEMSQLQTALKDITDRHNKEKKRRQGLHNLLMELRGNIRVHCRLRPLMEFDCGTEDQATLGKPGSKSEVVAHCYDDENICVKTSKHNKVFEYERVFNPTEDQPVVFDEVQPMLTSLLDGYNVCIMAYGQTGSGKTHTMLGSHNNDDYNPCETMHPDEGVIPRATRELFRLIEEKPVGSHTIEVSVVEIYNNDIKDLLSKSSTTKHELVTGSDGLLNLPTITSKPVSTVYDVMSLVQRGLRTRSESATLVHDHSSRSHLIVTLTVTSVAPSFFTVSKTDNDNLQTVKKAGGRPQSQPNLWSGDQPTNQTAVIKTKLQLVDLAGSECVGMSGVKGAALREASHINKSLSALADVLGALAEHRTHIPYRNSRLTHFLQDSIGGDSKLLVLLCVSPAARYTSESLQCLGFGQRARQVQRGPAKRRLPTYDQNSPRPKSATAVSSPKM